MLLTTSFSRCLEFVNNHSEVIEVGFFFYPYNSVDRDRTFASHLTLASMFSCGQRLQFFFLKCVCVLCHRVQKLSPFVLYQIEHEDTFAMKT